jgi:serine-type D-Ala-D-Ala carboxypeptidase/endopeptidase (penicillin-binding protein 4)
MPHRLGRFAVLALMVSPPFVALIPSSAQARPAATTAALSAQVRQAFHGSSAGHVDYRIQVAGLGTISNHATRASAPASNQKLFTVITLLELVGPAFRYTTPVAATSAVGPHGTLRGALVLRGSGDPTLTIASLRSMAKRLHAKGLRHVSGGLIVDDSRYGRLTRAPGWKHKFVPEESGTVDAFTVDDNEWRGGKSFDADPTYDNAVLWRHELRKAHISVAGRIRIMAAPPPLHRLVTHKSASLGAIVANTLTNSVNFNAEMMLREAGAQRSGFGSLATGIAAEHAVARQLGLPLGTVHDGSGLSYTDRETPATIERWLATLKILPPAIFNTVSFGLPVSCETGTLVNRMCGPFVRGNVHAKTGTLNHNSALSGYATTASGRAVTFSFLISGFKDSNFSRVLNHLDAAVAVIVRNG